MAAPQGAVAKLAWHEETTWGESAATLRAKFAAAEGYRLYFDSCVPDLRKDPVDIPEISGVESIDHSEFVEGQIGCSLTVSFRLRYSGLHAALLAYALGTLTTTGAGPYNHRGDLADDLPSLGFMWGPPDTVNTVFDNWIFSGMKCARMTIAHTAGEPILVTQEWIGKTWDFDDDSSQTWPDPVTTATLGPHEPYVQWHDVDAGTLLWDADSAAQVTMNCRSWEIQVENNISPRFLLQDGRYGAEPARDTKREITARVTLEKNLAWEQLAEAFGITGATTSDPGDLMLDYDGPGTNEAAFFRLNNCRVTSIPPVVSGEGPLEEEVSFRAHVDASAAADLKYPIWFDIDNDEQGPAGSNPATWQLTV